jgi:hypothetical protein
MNIAYRLFLGLFVVVLSLCFVGCQKHEAIRKKEVVVMVDLTDSLKYKYYKEDIEKNLKSYLQKHWNKEKIDSGDQMTVSIIPISANSKYYSKYQVQFDLSNDIQLNGMERDSVKALEKSTNVIGYKNIDDLIKVAIRDFDKMVTSPENIEKSSILSRLIKVVSLLNNDNDVQLLVFSDMIENSTALNMYTSIDIAPDKIGDIVNACVGEDVINKFNSAKKIGLKSLGIDIVMYYSEKDVQRQNKIKSIWDGIFIYLFGENRIDVKYGDNLEHIIRINNL